MGEKRTEINYITSPMTTKCIEKGTFCKSSLLSLFFSCITQVGTKIKIHRNTSYLKTRMKTSINTKRGRENEKKNKKFDKISNLNYIVFA